MRWSVLVILLWLPAQAWSLGLELVKTSIGAFPDHKSREMWFHDMDERLAKRVPDPEQRQKILELVYQEANRANLQPELVLAVIQVESNFDPWAISHAGAIGLMQVMPFWLEEIGQPGDNLFHVPTNLRLGCTILRHYLDIEKGNLVRALARYNGSLGSYRYPRLVLRAMRTWAAAPIP